MKLNHINLVVTNVAEATQFFERYFSFICITVKGDNLISVLKGADGFELVLMSSSMNKEAGFGYPENFHIGFKQNAKEAVDDLYNSLAQGGISTGREPGNIRGSYGFYFYFDNIMIEIGTD